jgi:protein TonB
MFEHYLQHQVPDSRRRWRVALAVNIAGFRDRRSAQLHVADGQDDDRPGHPADPALRDGPDGDGEPPAAASAPRRTGDPTRARGRAGPDEDPLTPPDSFVETLPSPRPRVAKVTGNGAPDSKGTLPFGNPTGLPASSAAPRACPRDPGIAVRTDPRPEPTRAPLPIATVRAQAIYAPAPDQNKLGATKAAMFDRRPGENETAFCVDPQGRTTDVRTTKKFPGDPKVDEICRDTIKTWRFKPFLVDGRPTKTCSVQVFNITFQ